MKKRVLNIVFNCDSTLVTIEGPVEIAKRKKIKQVDLLTEQAMRGEASFFDIFRRRFELYQPTLDDIRWLGQQYIQNITPGARALIKKINQAGHRIYIVSAGYRPAILKLAHELKIPSHHVCAVDIEFDDKGNYLHCDLDNILTTDAGTQIVLAEIQKSGPTIYIGDSVRDLDAQEVVDLFIGFGGVVVRPRVQEEAKVFINDKNLMPVLEYIQKLEQK